MQNSPPLLNFLLQNAVGFTSKYLNCVVKLAFETQKMQFYLSQSQTQCNWGDFVIINMKFRYRVRKRNGNWIDLAYE